MSGLGEEARWMTGVRPRERRLSWGQMGDYQ
jgi:hypothetical protein